VMHVYLSTAIHAPLRLRSGHVESSRAIFCIDTYIATLTFHVHVHVHRLAYTLLYFFNTQLPTQLNDG
jgi:hypothetical protein